MLYISRLFNQHICAGEKLVFCIFKKLKGVVKRNCQNDYSYNTLPYSFVHLSRLVPVHADRSAYEIDNMLFSVEKQSVYDRSHELV